MAKTTITRAELETLAAHENVPHNARYVVVGNDGSRPCVWGAGATSDEAETDAERWLSEAETCLANEETETLEIVEAFAPTHALINGNTGNHHLVQEIDVSVSYTRYVDRSGKTRAFRSSGATYVGDKTQPEGDSSHYVFDRLMVRDGRYYSECLGRFV